MRRSGPHDAPHAPTMPRPRPPHRRADALMQQSGTPRAGPQSQSYVRPALRSDAPSQLPAPPSAAAPSAPGRARSRAPRFVPRHQGQPRPKQGARPAPCRAGHIGGESDARGAWRRRRWGDTKGDWDRISLARPSVCPEFVRRPASPRSDIRALRADATKATPANPSAAPTSPLPSFPHRHTYAFHTQTSDSANFICAHAE
ncbi:hypothetical protein CERSUDRAFT_90983 [Gelatoporia subvermispora B]|uniref:Uncharacterized protein n=1 Tax=Ceriporiopsis subvermispora (strain B) TaxID=914234 RepID=M2R759_CERS8|nr:hypothetical protein CERSUDRAFT_90983 [Gelatoporia subvermispora B]